MKHWGSGLKCSERQAVENIAIVGGFSRAWFLLPADLWRLSQTSTYEDSRSGSHAIRIG